MDAVIYVSVCVRVRALGKPMSQIKNKKKKKMTPRNFSKRLAEERNEEVALTGHLGAAQVRRAQT